MKTLSLLFISALLISESASCQQKPMRIVFQSTKSDSATGLNKGKVYRLKKQVVNADLNYAKLADIDGNIQDTVNLKNLMPIFEPVTGAYTYYQFMATFRGKGYRDEKDFHDILIIKTNKENKIVDAFQYTLEWAESPLQYDLYKCSARGIVLRNNMDISQLKFVKKDNYDEEPKELNEKGIVSLKFD